MRTQLGVVAAGGALGAVARWALLQSAPDVGTGFPWTTFVINVSGSLLLALLPAVVAAAARRRGRDLPLLTPFLGSGVLGGWTTFSATSEQARAMLDAGATATAAAYVVGSLGAALLAVVVGTALGSLLESHDRAAPA